MSVGYWRDGRLLSDRDKSTTPLCPPLTFPPTPKHFISPLQTNRISRAGAGGGGGGGGGLTVSCVLLMCLCEHVLNLFSHPGTRICRVPILVAVHMGGKVQCAFCRKLEHVHKPFDVLECSC